MLNTYFLDTFNRLFKLKLCKVLTKKNYTRENASLRFETKNHNNAQHSHTQTQHPRDVIGIKTRRQKKRKKRESESG